jgi:hypothetical protein
MLADPGGNAGGWRCPMQEDLGTDVADCKDTADTLDGSEASGGGKHEPVDAVHERELEREWTCKNKEPLIYRLNQGFYGFSCTLVSVQKH